MKLAIKERLEGHSLGEFLRLFAGKLRILLGGDDGPLIYAGGTIAHPGVFRVLSNGAWMALWALTLWAMVRLLRGRLALPLTLPILRSLREDRPLPDPGRMGE